MFLKAGIESVMFPKSMSHLLEPIDLATNAAFKSVRTERSVNSSQRG